MTLSTSFPQAPENGLADDWTVRELIRVINNIMRGKTNNRGTVTLTANTTTTAVSDINAGGESLIFLMPLTANAAAAIGTTYIATQGKESFTITHANNAQTDRDFRYIVIG